MRRDITIHPAGDSDDDGTVALDVAENMTAHLGFIGHDSVEKMDVATLFNHHAMAEHAANVLSARADVEFTRAVDVSGNTSLNSEIPAVNFSGAKIAVSSDKHVAAGADGGGGDQIDLEILQADIDSTLRTVGGFRRSTDFKKVVTVEAFDFLEIMLKIASLLHHLVKGALRGHLLAGGGLLKCDYF